MKFIQNILLISALFIMATACTNPDQNTTEVNGNANNGDTLNAASPSSVQAVDSALVAAVVKDYVSTEKFRRDYEIDSIGEVYTDERPILIGDLNGDGHQDAIAPFTVEGAGGGNHYEIYYAVLINDGGNLKIKEEFVRGGKLSDYIINFESIDAGTVKGWKKPGFHSDNKDSIAVSYKLSGQKLVPVK